MPISQIEVGDLVLAWDEATGELVERPVIAVLPHPDDEIAELTIDGQAITTTPDHPFFTVERGWVEAGDLRPGDHVQRVSGSGVVESVTTAPYSGILWDLTVEGAHTFHVGDGQWLVHNCNLHSGWRGTNMSSHDSFVYHAQKHGRDVAPAQYAEDARAWADTVDLSTGSPLKLADGTTGVRIRTPGGGPGGIVDSDRNLITFWYR